MPITVTVLDTAGIQPYIFGSNVLRENIGGSELVHRATRLWAFEALSDVLEANGLRDQHNINLEAARQDRVERMYTDAFQVDGSDRIGAEVLYAGGGNTVILFQAFDPLELAQAFVYRLSLRLLTDAPGLNLYAAHKPYQWENTKAGESLPEIVTETIKELGRGKGRDPGSLPALGWPVTAACTSTGLPANGRHPDKNGKTGSASRANRQVAAKWKAARADETQPRDNATTRLRSLFDDVGRSKEFDWADEFDELADLPERDDSYIAVVHADGNGMGRRIKQLTDDWATRPKEPRGYIDKMRALSSSVQATAQMALKNTFTALLKHLTDYSSVGPTQHPTKRTYKSANGQRVPDKVQKLFPVRPVVFGGDDVTLVCAGPWGLAIAQRYLWELEQLSLTEDPADKPYACAGVAIVKTHYPFSQAYELSEALTKGAKKRADCLAKKKASALDWHLTTTGLHGDLGYIRRREYVVGHGQLTMRPLMLYAKGSLTHDDKREEWQTWRNWTNLTGLLDVFGEDGNWREQHNKTMRLREALRRETAAVAEFMIIFEEDETDILRRAQFEATTTLKNGWLRDDDKCLDPAKDQELQKSIGPRCVYFDAIEIADHCFELPNEKEGA